MLYRILAALAGVTLVTSLTSSVYAMPSVRSQSNPGVLTLLGGDGHGIESRSIAKDYQTRFYKPVPNSLNNNISYGIPTSKPAGKSDFLSEILGKDLGSRLEFNTGEIFDSPSNTNQSIFSQNSDSTDSKGSVLYKLTK